MSTAIIQGTSVCRLRPRLAQYPDAPAAAIEQDVQAFLVEAAQQGWIHHD